MKVIYYTLTGNIRRFILGCQLNDTEELKDEAVKQIIEEPFILITPTVGFGDIPEAVKIFLTYNYANLVAVASSGNKNWGANFAVAGEHISRQYNVPLLMKFELHGTDIDRINFKKKVGEIDVIYSK